MKAVEEHVAAVSNLLSTTNGLLYLRLCNCIALNPRLSPSEKLRFFLFLLQIQWRKHNKSMSLCVCPALASLKYLKMEQRRCRFAMGILVGVGVGLFTYHNRITES